MYTSLILNEETHFTTMIHPQVRLQLKIQIYFLFNIINHVYVYIYGRYFSNLSGR